MLRYLFCATDTYSPYCAKVCAQLQPETLGSTCLHQLTPEARCDVVVSCTVCMQFHSHSDLVQVGFFDVVAMPLFRSWCAILTDARPMLIAVEENRQKWKAMDQPHK